MTAQEVMTRNTATIDYDKNVLDAVRIMMDRRIRHLPVIKKGQVMGILSVNQLQSLKTRFEDALVGDICDKFIVYAAPESSLEDIMRAFTEVKVDAMPVLDINGHVMGDHHAVGFHQNDSGSHALPESPGS